MEELSNSASLTEDEPRPASQADAVALASPESPVTSPSRSELKRDAAVPLEDEASSARTQSLDQHGSAAYLRSAVSAQARRARLLGKDGLTFFDKVRLAYWNAFQHDCINTAKATAYSGIFAIFPALLVAAAGVAMLPYSAPLRFQLAIFFDRIVPASVAPLLEHYFTTAHSGSGRVLLGTLLVSFSGAAGVLGTLMEGFRRAYLLTDECWGPGMRGNLRRWMWSFLLVPIALVPLTVASLLVVFGHLVLLELQHYIAMDRYDHIYFVANAVRWSFALTATAAVLAAIYRFGVPARPAWRCVLPGAAFATATWFLSTAGFGWYVTHLGNYSRTYGSLGTGIVLLLWLFLTSFTVLCGAELNAELDRDHLRR